MLDCASAPPLSVTHLPLLRRWMAYSAPFSAGVTVPENRITRFLRTWVRLRLTPTMTLLRTVTTGLVRFFAAVARNCVVRVSVTAGNVKLPCASVVTALPTFLKALPPVANGNGFCSSWTCWLAEFGPVRRPDSVAFAPNLTGLGVAARLMPAAGTPAWLVVKVLSPVVDVPLAFVADRRKW